MSTLEYFAKIDIMKHVKARVQRWGPRARMTEVEAHMALVCASTNNGSVVDWTLSY